jgi:hypothetical protein
LQLYCEIKLLTQEPSNQIIAYHVESTTLDDRDYELVSKTEPGFFEDLVNVVETLTEALNQSSEILDTPASSPAQEGKPRCMIGPTNGLIPTTRYISLLYTRTDGWEYVLRSRQEYDHVVVLQTYVLHNWCAYGPAVACDGPDP